MLGSTADSCSCVRLRRLLRFTLQKTAEIPQLQFFEVVDILRGAETDFHGLAVLQTMVILHLQFLNAVIDALVVQVVQVHFPVAAQRFFPWSRRSVGP